MGNFKIISVESRKGGVGKTTAALNLGYLLRENYHILLLDIDITGTSIRAVQESRFWMKDTRLLTNIEGYPLNLLKYFTDTYLKGKELFDFTCAQEPGKIQVEDGTINVIASELYDEDASLLYDPSLLLDNLHIYWLTRLITSICDRFEGCFNDEKQCVIILDNSPGFVGIGKAVHNLLTDKGPNEAKCLTVSSLDIQDLESSLKSVFALHKEYVDKLNGSRYPETQKGDRDFYTQMTLSGVAEYTYYRVIEEEAPIKSYQGMIINKVSRDIVDERTEYDFNRISHPVIRGVYDELFADGIKEYLVPFDSVLMTQFYGVFEEKSNKERPNHTILKKRLNTIEGQIKMLEDLGPDVLPYDILRRAEGFDKTIDALKGALIASGYGIMASKFNPDWSPMAPIREMIEALKKLGLTSESFELYIPRRTRMQHEMEYFHGIAGKAMSFAERRQQEFVWLASTVASLACELSFCYSSKIIWNDRAIWDEERIEDVGKEKWVNKVNDVLSDWLLEVSNGFLTDTEHKTTLAAYVIGKDIEIHDSLLRELFDDIDFVRLFKTSVSRLVDLSSDMRTLINLIRLITINNEGSYTLDVDFAPFLNHKIIDKKYSYSEAKDRMYGDLRDSDYMAAYREVLRRVINQWGL